MNHRDELLRAFRIEVADLEANRVGRLGATQQRNLLRSGIWGIAGALLIGLLIGALLYAVATKPLAPIQWIVAIGLFAVVLIVGIRYLRQTRAAVADGRVECLVGPVRVGSRGRAGWYLTVAGQSFRLPVRPWNVQQGATYRVYIAPHTGSIVAIEPADS
jgi:hypothetical protein